MAHDDGRSAFAGGLIACMADRREPTVHELFSVAGKVWTDGAAERSASAWDRLSSNDADLVRALRAAQAALTRNPDEAGRAGSNAFDPLA